ncbi:autophagy protein 5 [Clarireedia jacksonii]
MQSLVWASTIPLYITHPSSTIPYLINIPRVSYLPLLLPRLTLFFGEDVVLSSFTYEGILLKNLPAGLLCDLYQPQLPWRIELGDGPLFDIHDTFINSVKEADFIRNSNAKGIMSMSKEHSTQLWNSVQDNDFATYLKISTILLNPATPLKHIPLRIYLPSSTPNSSSLPATKAPGETPLYTFRTIQTLIPPHTVSKEPQTIGSAMNSILPTLFPSRRDAILAEVILHGATVPFKAVLEELMREASYADGWINVCVVMLN